MPQNVRVPNFPNTYREPSTGSRTRAEMLLFHDVALTRDDIIHLYLCRAASQTLRCPLMANQLLPSATTNAPPLTSAASSSQWEQVWDCEEAAQFLRIHPATLKRLARSGRLP